MSAFARMPATGGVLLDQRKLYSELAVGGADCTDAGGEYQGDDTDCGSVSCPQPGACCILGICTILANEMLDGSQCDMALGEYQGADTVCASVECPGSCCFDTGVCFGGFTEFFCLNTLGADFFASTSTECQLTGACCLVGGTCKEFSEPCCRAANGLFQGAGTVCGMVLGACCFDSGDCEELDAACCARCWLHEFHVPP